MLSLAQFNEVWLVDFEFHQPDGERPQPLCMVAREFHTGRYIHLWLEGRPDGETGRQPLSLNPQTPMVAYHAPAELGCFLALGWRVPPSIIDLHAEFRCLTSGLQVPHGHGLLGAMAYFGLDGISALEKTTMRDLARRGGPYTEDERQALLDYCQTDVDALARLLPAMAPRLDLGHALLRGRYTVSVAEMERRGIPLDIQKLARLKEHWPRLKELLVERTDRGFGVFEGTSFRASKFEVWLAANGIPWPRLPSGALDLKDDTFKEMGRGRPEIESLRQLRHTLSNLRLGDLWVGRDGRNRALLSPFGATTGRNTPSTTKFIFGPSTWIRSLIAPECGMALAYIDYEQQEFGIAAALSGDVNMKEAYLTGDPYLAFGIRAGGIPVGGTKASHGAQRDLYKQCALGVQYSIGAERLATRLRASPAHARELLEVHRQSFPAYWRWSDAAQNTAMLTGGLTAAFGWKVHVGTNSNPRSLRNFPLQANGAEMLRIACCLASERGVWLCAPVHDALLIEAPIEDIDHAVTACQECMREASEIVLGGGFSLRTERQIIRHPDYYVDARGSQLWMKVWDLIAEVEGSPVPIGDTSLSQSGTDVPYPQLSSSLL